MKHVLSPKQINIWRIHLLQDEHVINSCRNLLSGDEIERANRFHFAKHRRRFVIARAAAREILGKYLEISPRKLIFSYGAKGRPEISNDLNKRAMKFSLSHSRDLALLAIAQGLSLGIDVEFINGECATDDIAERVFAPREIRTLRSIIPTRRVEAFFSCWTRKEAYVKALGEGLGMPLKSFDVPFGPGVSAAVISVRMSAKDALTWSIYDINAAPGYKAALVIEGEGHQMRYRRWKSSKA